MNVLMADFPTDDPAIERGLLAIAGMTLILHPGTESQSLSRSTATCHALLTMHTPIDSQTMRDSPNLGLICVPSEDTSHIDLTVAKSLGIWVSHVPKSALSTDKHDDNFNEWREEERRLSILGLLAWCTQGRPYHVVSDGYRLPPPAYRQAHLNR